MSKIKFELNEAGVRELLKSTEMQSIINTATTNVNKYAGSDYESDVQTHNRVVGRVYASTYKARKDNYENNTLLKALHK